MKINVTLRVSDGHELLDVIEIEEHKLGELSDDDIEAAIEMMVRRWVDKTIEVEWETEED